MNIMKTFYGQRSVRTREKSADPAKRTAVILRYYRTVCLKDGIFRHGICIDAVKEEQTESYLAFDVCAGAKDAEKLLEQLFRHAVFPCCAEECLDEILSSEILSSEILSPETFSAENLSDVRDCA